MSETRAFITGSYRYGMPHSGSDLDLVVLVDDLALAMLKALGDIPTNPEEYAPIRFGRLNIIACTNRTTFDAWQKGTEELVELRPVPRGVAKEYLQKKREEAYGVYSLEQEI